MEIKNTGFYFFNDMCIEKYAAESGNSIINSANHFYQQLRNEADDKSNQAIRWHMEQNMLPTIAYYKALLEAGYSKETAYELVLEMTQRFACEARNKNKKLGKMKLAYFIFKLVCKKFMGKNYPTEGWITEWVTYNKNEIHMNFKSCIYHDTTCKYECPELCTVFCKNDPTVFDGYKPGVVFKRSGTIAEGKEVCDFHFYNGKRYQENMVK